MTSDPVRPTPERANATGLPTCRRDNLGTLVFDMEDQVYNLVRWAKAICDLGLSGGEVSADGLHAIGHAMLGDAEAVFDDWKQCFELTRDRREGDR